MVMYAKIRRMFFREHLSISEIARRTTLTRNTIKKWLKAADGSEPKYRRPPKLTKLTPFEPKILMALTPDGKKLYVANGRSNSVSVIDTAENKRISDIPVGNLPWGVVIH
jgi:YVTN family beta-propeller protein